MRYLYAILCTMFHRNGLYRVQFLFRLVRQIKIHFYNPLDSPTRPPTAAPCPGCPLFPRHYPATPRKILPYSRSAPLLPYSSALQRHNNPAGTRLPNVTGPFLAPSLRSFHFPDNTTFPKYICCYLPALIWIKGTSLSLPVPNSYFVLTISAL